MSDLVTSFEAELVRRLGEQAKDAHFVVACSGGVDSVVLLHLAVQALGPGRLTVAHYHHNQRGRAATADASLVKKLAARLKVKFKTEKRKSREPAGEEVLRRARRKFLEKWARGIAKRGHAPVFILTAHHRDDQIETFFFRLLRGSGVRGLVGMRAVQGRYVRPLLSLAKKDLVATARLNKWKWREDESNQQPRYFRNQLRQRLLPEWNRLTESFGGEAAWSARFSKLLEELDETEQAITQQAQLMSYPLLVKTPYWIRLTVVDFCGEVDFWQRAILRNLFLNLDKRALTRRETERLCALLKKGKGRAQLSNECDVVVSQGYAFLSARETKLPQFSIPVAKGVVMRNLRVGDRFRGKTLSERLKKAKVPSPERALYPVLARKNSREILWHPLSKKRGKEGVTDGGQFGANFKPSFDASWYRASY